MREQPAARQHLLRVQLCQGEGHSWPLVHAGSSCLGVCPHSPCEPLPGSPECGEPPGQRGAEPSP